MLRASILASIVLALGIALVITFARNRHDIRTSTVQSINAIIEDVLPNVKVVKIIEKDENLAFAKGACIDGRIEVSLPENVNSVWLYPMWQNIPSGVKISDTNARFAFAELKGYDEEGEMLLGEFLYFNLDATIGFLLYADRAVTVTGKDNDGDTWNASFKQGWNFKYIADSSITTSDPGGMSWYFFEEK